MNAPQQIIRRGGEIIIVLRVIGDISFAYFQLRALIGPMWGTSIVYGYVQMTKKIKWNERD